MPLVSFILLHIFLLISTHAKKLNYFCHIIISSSIINILSCTFKMLTSFFIIIPIFKLLYTFKIYYILLIDYCQQNKIIYMKSKKTELTKKFGWKVKIERMKKKISQEKLAEKAGLNKNSLGLIERGETTPSIETANNIANALGIKLPELIDVDKIEF